MPVIVGHGSLQKSRTLWASIETMVSCIVANVPFFHSLLLKYQRRRSNCTHRNPYHHGTASAQRHIRMPVTGQNSSGSLTRNDGKSTVGTRSIGVLSLDLKLILEQPECASQGCGIGSRQISETPPSPSWGKAFSSEHQLKLTCEEMTVAASKLSDCTMTPMVAHIPRVHLERAWYDYDV